MYFESGSASFDLVMQSSGYAVAAFAQDTEVHRQVVARLHHLSNMCLARGAICGDRGRTVNRVVSHPQQNLKLT